VRILLYSRLAVVITLVYVWLPFVALPIYASLLRINPSLLEAAAILGASPWRSFFRVTLPLSLPGVIAGFFMVFIPTVGEYITPILVGGTRGSLYGNIIGFTLGTAQLAARRGDVRSHAGWRAVHGVDRIQAGRFPKLGHLAMQDRRSHFLRPII
jgi:ABC-type spermidine/putrescine transport system permease subunit I